MKSFIFLTVHIFCVYGNIVHFEKPKEKDKFEKLRITEKNYPAIKNVHKNWYTTSLKALMGQMGKQLYENLNKEEKKRMAWCLDNVEEKHDLVHAARCLVRARKHHLERKVYENEFGVIKKIEKSKKKISTIPSPKDSHSSHEWIGGFKVTGVSKKEQFPKSFIQKSKDIRRYPQSKIRMDNGKNINGKKRNEKKLNKTKEGYREKKVDLKKLNELIRLEKMKKNVIQQMKKYKQHPQPHLRPRTLKRIYIGKLRRPKLVPVISPQPKHDLGSKIIEIPHKGKQFSTPMIGFHPSGLESKHFDFKKKYFTSFRFEKYRMRRRFSRRFFAHRRIKRSEYRLDDRDIEDDGYAQEFKIKQMEKLPQLNSHFNHLNPVTKFTDFLRTMFGKKKQKDEIPENREMNLRWPKTYKTLLKINKEIDEKKKLPGSRPYKLRMYDIIIGNDEPTLSPKDRRGPAGLLQQGMQLIQHFKGENNTDVREGMNLRFLSPRFMPVMPDKIIAKNEQLSPTIMSFYRDNRTIAALPDVLDNFRMSSRDRESILSMLMDVTETTKHVNTALDVLKELNFFDAAPEILNSTEKINDAYDALQRSLNGWQQKNLKKNGYAFLEKYQMVKVYRDQGVEHALDLSDFDDYANYTHEQREIALWNTIEQISKNITSADEHRRMKRLGEFPFFFLAPVVLAPFAFAPTFGLSVLGPLVISPFIFSPLIINPSVLSPFLLSPGVAVPLIVSPYIFGPFILGPYVMMPFILSPYVISPNVLNPYVLSPLILNPTVLSPDVLSPQILGGGVLSPTVGSPAVLTETTLMGAILSPSFLS